MQKLHKIWRLVTIAALLAGALNLSLVPVTPVRADSTAQTLPFSQNWSNASLLTVTDDWSGVAGIIGYRGDNLTAATGIDPQTVLADDTPGVVDINVDQTNPSTNSSGGLGEFTLTDPVVALQGSGTADAPYLLVAINTTGKSNINVAYNLRDLDGSTDNAVQAVALQYRVGNSGTFTNVASGYVADATTGPSLATLVTPVSATLPAAADNQALVQVRIITTNAASNDEWVGVDDISITENITPPNLTITDVSASEDNSGTTAFSFTVSLDADAPAGGVTFDIATEDVIGGATAGVDYVANSDNLTIAAGADTANFVVAVNGDTAFESDETFNVNVTNVTNATITDGQAVGTIQNDDPPPPALSIDDVSMAEGDSGTTIFTFTVDLDANAPAGGVSFDIATADVPGGATAGVDYVANSDNLTIVEDADTATFDVTVNGDTDFEADETFNVNVTNVTNATITDDQGVGTITNEDAPVTPTLSINDVTVTEGNSGTTTASFTVNLSPSSASDVTFDIATSGGDATAGSDYVANSVIPATISAGDNSYTFDVTVNGDEDLEDNETFNVNITNPSTDLSDGIGVGTISNDDAGLSIANVSVTEGDSGTKTATFTVTLSQAVSGPVTFDIATSGGDATAGVDYVAKSLPSQTITAGATTYTFDVLVNGDTAFETDETFNVTVTGVTGAVVTDGTAVGAIENDDAAPANLSIADVTLAEGNTGTTTFGFVVTLDAPAPTGGVTFDIATSVGTATAGTDYVAQSITGQTIVAGGTTYPFNVTVNGDWDNEPNETFNVTVSSVSGAVVFDGAALGTITNDDSVTPIHDIQGSGSSAVISTFTVDAIVVGDYQAQTSGQLKGFFIQEEDADADANPATSEGIFVYCNTCPTAVNVGDRVRVKGASEDYYLMSQIDVSDPPGGEVTVISSGNNLPTPASLTLPIPGVPTGDLTAAETFINAYYEAFEGMLVKFPATLSVSEYFELARYGQVILSAGGRPHTFTAVNEPTELGYTNHQIDLAGRTIILDDTDNRQNRPSDAPNTAYYYPVPGLSTSNYFRGGDTITDLTGVLHWSFAGLNGTDAWRIRPVTEKYSYAFTPVNPRTTVPSVDGSLKVASFNVLNYFLTIDTSNVCAPTQNQDCRGADSAQELERQRAKMLAALTAIDADVFGFMEMENTPGKEPLADIVNIVDGLPGYDYIDTGVIGGDAIRVGIIYKTSTVTPVGAFKLLTSTVDPRFDDTKNRPALAQTFEEIATGETFTVVVNHLKSKGSSCGTGDDDTTTGQGNCNLTRTEAAEALADWLDTDPTGSGDPDFLIIGDLNSYAMEDPIVALETAGFTNLVESFGGADAYGYVFDGQLGYLDHALANTDLLPQVADLAEWHINADENPLFDYNDDVRTADEAAFDEESDTLPLYAPNEFRTSDHDPIIIGLNLDSTGAPTITSIARAGTNPTNAASVNFTVTFSEAVTGVDTGDFEVNMGGTVSGASVTTVNPISASVYTVTVNTGSGDGTVRLDAKTAATIEDTLGNPFAGPYTSGEFYTIDKTVPTVTSIVPAGTNPTNADSIPFTVTFSEAVFNVGSNDFSLDATGTVGGLTFGSVSGSGTTYTVTFNNVSGDGTVAVDMPIDATVSDEAGNGLGNVPYENGGLYTIDNTVPTVTMSSAALNPTNASLIAVTVQFSEAVNGFTIDDIATLNGSVGDFLAVDDDTYTFNLTPSGQGLVTADIAQNAASDDAGNGNTQASQFSRTYDSVVPTVTMSSVVSDPVHDAAPISVTVQFSETVSGFTIDDITAVNGSVSNFVAGDGDTYTFDLTPIAPGLVTVDIDEDAASDAAGNGNTAAAQFQRTYSLHTLFLPLIKR